MDEELAALIKQMIIGAALAFGIIALGIYAYSVMVAPAKGEIIVSKVTLKNPCEIDDSVFMLYLPKTGRRISFSNGTAEVKVKAGDPTRLVSSPAYPKVQYEGVDRKAARNLTLEVDCNPTDFERLFNRPMKDQFDD